MMNEFVAIPKASSFEKIAEAAFYDELEKIAANISWGAAIKNAIGFGKHKPSAQTVTREIDLTHGGTTNGSITFGGLGSHMSVKPLVNPQARAAVESSIRRSSQPIAIDRSNMIGKSIRPSQPVAGSNIIAQDRSKLQMTPEQIANSKRGFTATPKVTPRVGSPVEQPAVVAA